ncbi:hypothetical protein AAFF_G00360570 [Aldrovandia affinis]|uniref:Uncharacterized protein n=1 Tax=Aldrovandia affinis TaxID=143900 RepID=A0AAD7SIB7_9TELE|nr:hypothetical protein AAFF_G00360570 [Aldrovandia affinis]
MANAVRRDGEPRGRSAERGSELKRHDWSGALINTVPLTLRRGAGLTRRSEVATLSVRPGLSRGHPRARFAWHPSWQSGAGTGLLAGCLVVRWWESVCYRASAAGAEKQSQLADGGGAGVAFSQCGPTERWSPRAAVSQRWGWGVVLAEQAQHDGPSGRQGSSSAKQAECRYPSARGLKVAGRSSKSRLTFSL